MMSCKQISPDHNNTNVFNDACVSNLVCPDPGDTLSCMLYMLTCSNTSHSHDGLLSRVDDLLMI